MLAHIIYDYVSSAFSVCLSLSVCLSVCLSLSLSLRSFRPENFLSHLFFFTPSLHSSVSSTDSKRGETGVIVWRTEQVMRVAVCQSVVKGLKYFFITAVLLSRRLRRSHAFSTVSDRQTTRHAIKFNVALRPQRPYVRLLGTGSLGRPPRLSHS